MFIVGSLPWQCFGHFHVICIVIYAYMPEWKKSSVFFIPCLILSSIIFSPLCRTSQATKVGSFEGFTQSSKTLWTCFSFCRSYRDSAWKLSRGITWFIYLRFWILSKILYKYSNFLTFLTNVQAHVFKSRSGACAAFLANYNPQSYATVAFGNQHYNLPPWSISILPNCKHTVYNTARVRKKIELTFISND